MGVLPVKNITIVTGLSEKEVLYRLFLFAHNDKNSLLKHVATGWNFNGDTQNNVFRFTYYKKNAGRQAFLVSGSITRKNKTMLNVKVSMASIKVFYFRSFVYLLIVLLLSVPNIAKGDFVKAAFFLCFLVLPVADYLATAIALRRRASTIALELSQQVQGSIAP